MSDDPRDGDTSRDFGRLLGAAVLSGVLPNTTTGAHGASGEHDATPPPIEAPDELCEMTAVDLAARIRRKQGADVSRAAARQARLYLETAQFFERYDYFVAPVTQVEPFDVTIEYPTSVAGTPMPTYIDWMRSCWYVTLTACPAISVPAGFTARGLPVGLQIVGPHRGDWRVLQLAHAFEQATGHGKRRPLL